VAGVRETARFNSFLVAVKLVVIVLFVVSTVSAFSTANWIAPPAWAGLLRSSSSELSSA
jgi:APA family basic amino acid/polyamine antiporter